jgi:hypothetical protein
VAERIELLPMPDLAEFVDELKLLQEELKV